MMDTEARVNEVADQIANEGMIVRASRVREAAVEIARLQAENERLQVLVEHWKSLVAGYEQRDHPHGRVIVAAG